MNKEIIVEVMGETRKYSKEPTLIQVYNDFKDKIKYSPLVARINNKIYELNEEIEESCAVEFINHTSRIGNRIYMNGLYFILINAYHEVFGRDKDLIIEHSLDKGTYIRTEEPINETTVTKIKKIMQEIVEEDYKIKKCTINIDDAVAYFRKHKQKDKLELLNYVTSDVVTLYKLRDLYDYFHTKMPASTACLKMFDLRLINQFGMVLTYPTEYNPDSIKEYVHPTKMFNIFNEYSKWIQKLNLSNAADINSIISKGNGDELIRISETAQNEKIHEVSEQILEKIDRIKIILIAGPSSSGKTTTSKKLALHLKSKGITPKNISIDDFYLERESTPKDENGEYDFECLGSIDTKLFNEQLSKLIRGEEVILPKYNFLTGKKEYEEKNRTVLKDNEVLIIEGIHGHNEKLTEEIPENAKFKIYISPLTQLNIDNHNRVYTTDTRLLRRMVRDYKYRGYSPENTIKEWQDVRRGEEKWIFPYQDKADVVLNSALVYEISVLRPYAESLLYSVEKDSPAYLEAKRLIYFLRNFLPLSSEAVPDDSLLREFIGGSSYREER